MKKPEVSKLSNKELIESAFKQIEEETGFHIINKKFGNCYFIFESEDDDTICHFEIEEIPGFLFAFWNANRVQLPLTDPVYISENTELIFFTQYKMHLDKFKPSRSGFVTGIYRQAWLEGEDEHKVEEWTMYQLIDILKYMKHNKLKSIFYATAQQLYVWEEISFFRALKEYISDIKYHIKSKIKDSYNLKKQIHASKRLAKSLHNINIIIRDFGPNWSPRLQIDIRRRSKINIDDYEYELSKLDKFDDKYWNKITIQQWGYDSRDKLTREQLEEDKDLGLKFDNKIKTIIKNKTEFEDEENEKLIYINVEDKYYGEIDS